MNFGGTFALNRWLTCDDAFWQGERGTGQDTMGLIGVDHRGIGGRPLRHLMGVIGGGDNGAGIQ